MNFRSLLFMFKMIILIFIDLFIIIFDFGGAKDQYKNKRQERRQ